MNVFKFVMKVLLIILVIFLICMAFFINYNASYDKNLFEVKLNGNLMKCYYTEKYNNGFIIIAKTEGFNAVENNVNNLKLEDRFILDISEYEAYYSNGYRKEASSDWLREDSVSYKKIKNNSLKLQIKRKNKVLYDGEHIRDISKYLNESGRYYIHVYSTRKDSILSSTKTHISFNVIVGGGNLYEKNKITSS